MAGQDSFLDQLNTWGTFILANLFWIVMSIPLITMPLATAGLFQVMSKWVRGKQPEVFQDFFGAIRQHWAGAYLIGLLDVICGGMVYLNLRILAMMGAMNAIAVMSRSVTLLVGLVLILVNMYLWSLLVIAELPMRRLVKLSIQLVFAHPLWSLGILIAAGVPLLVSLLAMPVLFVFLGSVSLSAWIINWGTWRIIRRYIPPDELNDLETKHFS